MDAYATAGEGTAEWLKAADYTYDDSGTDTTIWVKDATALISKLGDDDKEIKAAGFVNVVAKKGQKVGFGSKGNKLVAWYCSDAPKKPAEAKES
jgi:hypothetical protein